MTAEMRAGGRLDSGMCSPGSQRAHTCAFMVHHAQRQRPAEPPLGIVLFAYREQDL